VKKARLKNMAGSWPTADDSTMPFSAGGRSQQAERAIRRFREDALYRALYLKVTSLFAERLQENLDMVGLEGEQPSFCAKWCPGIDTSFDRRTLICEGIARQMWPRGRCAEYAHVDERHYAFRVRDRLRREVLVPLKRRFVELSSGDAGGGKHNEKIARTSGLAQPLTPLGRLLCAHDALAFWRFLRDIEKVKALAQTWERPVAQEWFSRDKKPERTELPQRVQTTLAVARWAKHAAACEEFVGQRGTLGGVAVIHDTSFSMEFECAPRLRCLEVASAIALANADAEGVFQNRAIIGGARPWILELPKAKARHRAAQLLQARQQNPLDLTSVLRLVLNEQSKANDDDIQVRSGNERRTMKPSVHCLLFLSDKDITTATNKDSQSLLSELVAAEASYALIGLPFPEVIFWNLMGSGSSPAIRFAPGLVLLSGFSLSLLDAALAPRGPGQPLDLSAPVARALATAPLAEARVLRTDSEAQREVSESGLLGVDVAVRSASPVHVAPLPRSPLCSVDLCLVVDSGIRHRAWSAFRGGELEALLMSVRAEAMRRTGATEICLRVGFVQSDEHGQHSVRPFEEECAFRQNPWRARYFKSETSQEHILSCLSTALTLEWGGDLRVVVLFAGGCLSSTSDRGASPSFGKTCKALMQRSNTLGVHLLMVCLSSAADSLHQHLERSCRVGDGIIPKIPWANRAFDPWLDGAGKHRRPLFMKEVVASALARRIAVILEHLDLPKITTLADGASSVHTIKQASKHRLHSISVVLSKELCRREVGNLIGVAGLGISAVRASLKELVSDTLAEISFATLPCEQLALSDVAARRERQRRRRLGITVWVDVFSSSRACWHVRFTLRGIFSAHELQLASAVLARAGPELVRERIGSQQDRPGAYVITAPQGVAVKDRNRRKVIARLHCGAIVDVAEVEGVADFHSFLWREASLVFGSVKGGWFPILRKEIQDNRRYRCAHRIPSGRVPTREQTILLARQRDKAKAASAESEERVEEQAEVELDRGTSCVEIMDQRKGLREFQLTRDRLRRRALQRRLHEKEKAAEKSPQPPRGGRHKPGERSCPHESAWGCDPCNSEGGPEATSDRHREG